MSHPANHVQPIHFEDFDGLQFERLVFAYHGRTEKWHSLEWYGQTGSDLGRDIWGIRDQGETVCVQCVNFALFNSSCRATRSSRFAFSTSTFRSCAKQAGKVN
jgi:hypothetical protein